MQDSNNHLSGIFFMVGGMLLLPGIDAIAKSVGVRVSVGEIVWCRFFFQSLLMAVAAACYLPKKQIRITHTSLHLLRSIMISIATLLFFGALQYMPLAESIAIFFIEPLLLTLLAAMFLKEGIGWRRSLAVVTGFAGSTLIVQPEFTRVGWPALLPVGAAFAFSIYLLLTKRLTGHTHPILIQLFTSVGAVLFLSLALLAGTKSNVEWLAFALPSNSDIALLALLGFIAASGHLLVVLAFARAPATVLAPLQYLEIVSATLLGWLLFDDFPNALAWLGVAIIIGSGLMVAWREKVLANHEQQ